MARTPARQFRAACRLREARRDWRTGSAAIELALAIPVVLLIVFGSVETANLVYLKQNLTDTAYHGTLIGVKQGATESYVQSQVSSMLAARCIQGASVDVAPGVLLEDLDRGQLFSIRIVAGTGENTPLSFVLPSRNIEVELVARRQ